MPFNVQGLGNLVKILFLLHAIIENIPDPRLVCLGNVEH